MSNMLTKLKILKNLLNVENIKKNLLNVENAENVGNTKKSFKS